METIKDELSLPYDEELERAVLGAIITFPEHSEFIFSNLKPEDFFSEKNRIIFTALHSIYTDGLVIDLSLIKIYLEKSGNYEKVGGLDYIKLLIEEAAVPSVLQQIVDVLREKRIRRSLIQISQTIIQKAKEKQKDIDSLLEEAENLIFSITENKEITAYHHFSDVLKETLVIINELAKKETVITGVPTGFYEIDRLTTGFHPGDLVIIAARPGMGKTSFALSILHYLSVIEGLPTAFFSLEMSKEQIAMRLLGEESKIPLRKIRSGFLSTEELEKIAEVSLKMMKAPLYIDDTASISILDLKAKARRLKKEADVKLIVVDYLQLLSSGRRSENRQQEVAEISRSLKALAKELGIPVVALAQLSRQAEMRSDKRPQLADLRESGAIEQDADLVMFIHRPEYYKKNPSPQEEGLAEIIIAKQRNGPTGIVNLVFIKEITKFENLASKTDIIEESEDSEDFIDYTESEGGVEF
ncbi:MAG: replicative DNA helicase [Hydrogenothermaceae bacterium]|nr:replicative DNA helicase [Hydrogenothermaceae bacterium]